MDRTSSMLARGFTALAWVAVICGGAAAGVGSWILLAVAGQEMLPFVVVWVVVVGFWTVAMWEVFMLLSLVSEYIGSRATEVGGQ